MTTLNRVDVTVKLKALADGNVLSLAEKIGVSHTYLSDVLRGTRFPGPRILDYLGLEKIAAEPLYRPKRGGSK